MKSTLLKMLNEITKTRKCKSLATFFDIFFALETKTNAKLGFNFDSLIKKTGISFLKSLNSASLIVFDKFLINNNTKKITENFVVFTKKLGAFKRQETRILSLFFYFLFLLITFIIII